MKIMIKKYFLGAVIPIAVFLIVIFSSCTPIHIGGGIVLKGDGSGSRTFDVYIYDQENDEGGGNARHYLKVSGDALKRAVEQKLRVNLKDSSWITVSVSQGLGAMSHAEIVTLSFEFSDFKDYGNKMKQLAKFGSWRMLEGSEFKASKLTKAPNNQLRFRETGKTSLWAIRPLFLSIIEDPNLFDITSGGRNTLFGISELRDMLMTEAVMFTATLGSSAPRLILSGTDIDITFPRGE